MRAMQIASAATVAAIAMVPEQTQILARMSSQLRTEFGHGVTWKSGAAYLTMKDFSTVVVPMHRLKSALRKYGQAVSSVR